MNIFMTSTSAYGWSAATSPPSATVYRTSFPGLMAFSWLGSTCGPRSCQLSHRSPTTGPAGRPGLLPLDYVKGFNNGNNAWSRLCDAEFGATGCCCASRQEGSTQNARCISSDRAAQPSMVQAQDKSPLSGRRKRGLDLRAATAGTHLVGKQAGEAVHGEAGAHGLLLRVHHVRLPVHLQAAAASGTQGRLTAVVPQHGRPRIVISTTPKVERERPQLVRNLEFGIRNMI